MESRLNELEVEDTKKLLLKYSIPAIVGSLVVALYNIIDSIYIGHGPELGDHAIGGLGIILPIMTLLTSLGVLVGTGATTRISLYMGKGLMDTAEKILGNALVFIVALTLLFIVFIYIFTTPLLHAIGATEDTFDFAHEFLAYYLPGSLFLNISFVLSGTMRASGYPHKTMYIMLLGVVINIILAPIFIFITEWGIKGAAIATSISTFISFVLFMLHFLKPSSTLRLLRNKISINPKTLWDITSIGLSPFIMQMAASLIIFVINNRLRLYGDSVAIEAYTIASRLTLVTILIIVGLTQGMQPIIGYNYGAQNNNRVISTVNQTIIAGASFGIIGMICGVFFSNILIEPFNPTPMLAEQASYALPILSVMLPLSGIQMVISNFFQSIGMPVKAVLLSLTRQVVFLLPLLFVLPYFFDLDGVWVSIPISDFFSTVLALGVYVWQIRKFNKTRNIISTI